MNSKRIRWRLSVLDSGGLSQILRPLRTQEEVGRLLGCSAELVAQLERSALRKIVSALLRLEPEQDHATTEV
jgi:DNA-directed RNA polymerase sigma subunit (sigma70/sigma32)